LVSQAYIQRIPFANACISATPRQSGLGPSRVAYCGRSAVARPRPKRSCRQLPVRARLRSGQSRCWQPDANLILGNRFERRASLRHGLCSSGFSCFRAAGLGPRLLDTRRHDGCRKSPHQAEKLLCRNSSPSAPVNRRLVRVHSAMLGTRDPLGQSANLPRFENSATTLLFYTSRSPCPSNLTTQ
jgi:hypothetical protein